MTNPLQQLLAVSVLIGKCEAITESGLLGEACERDLRWTVAQTLAAFNLPTRTERQDNTSLSTLARQQESVSAALNSEAHHV